MTISSSAAPFRYYLRVRYGECDAQKVVFNARYGDYLDLAMTEFLRTLGYGEALADGSFDCQLVRQTMEWKAPARSDQVLDLRVWSSHQGNSSFAITVEFRVAGDEAVISRGETIYVRVDNLTLKKRGLDADFRAALVAGAVGRIVDHAGYLA